MIGFVNVKIEHIIRAYTLLNSDEDSANEALSNDKSLRERIQHMSNVINTNAGNNTGFLRKKEKVKLKNMLQEVAYASYASNTDSMFIRIEMASIILDILKIYEGDVDLRPATPSELEETTRND